MGQMIIYVGANSNLCGVKGFVKNLRNYTMKIITSKIKKKMTNDFMFNKADHLIIMAATWSANTTLTYIIMWFFNIYG